MRYQLKGIRASLVLAIEPRFALHQTSRACVESINKKDKCGLNYRGAFQRSRSNSTVAAAVQLYSGMPAGFPSLDS